MGLPSTPRCRNGVNSLCLPARGSPATGRPPMHCSHIVASADAFVLHIAEVHPDPSVKEKELTRDGTDLYR